MEKITKNLSKQVKNAINDGVLDIEHTNWETRAGILISISDALKILKFIEDMKPVTFKKNKA